MRKKIISVCVTAVLALCCIFAVACGGNDGKIADNTEHVDAITKTLKLSKPFDGKRLMQEGGGGIEEATLIGETTDGDTSNFSLKSGGSVTVRYQGVDTPESTAGVEKWGKAASKFTNEQLKSATQIVIESAKSGQVPDKDSVGQRSLCYVWYKTASSDFKCLNLELVENGFSLNKEAATNAYYSYFQKAEEFARGFKLRLFSDLDDPLFNTAVIDISLKDLKANPNNYEENSKVRLKAYLTDMTKSGSGAITFEIAQYDATENKEYKLNLYAGYRGSAVNMRVGDLYQIVGTLQKHDGAWQISGVEVDNDSKGDEISWRAQLSYYLVFNELSPLYTQKVTSNCYGDVTVTELVGLEGKQLTFKGTAPKYDENKTPVEFTFKVTVPDDYNESIYEGARLSIAHGFQFEARSSVVTVTDYANLTIK